MAQTLMHRLRALRDERGLTQQELGEKAGMSPVMISHFETGRRTSPSIENLVKLADALDVSVDYLLGRSDDQSPSGSPLEAAFRSTDWDKTEERLGQLKDLYEVWAARDRRRGDDEAK